MGWIGSYYLPEWPTVSIGSLQPERHDWHVVQAKLLASSLDCYFMFNKGLYPLSGYGRVCLRYAAIRAFMRSKVSYCR